MRWLDQQPAELARHWLRRTDVPMIATHPNGKIFAANTAFCREMAYTEPELTRDGVSWMSLSRADEDMEADRENLTRLVAGDVSEYALRKHYLPKGGAPVPVTIHVLRWPIQGEISCCLVTVTFMPESSRTFQDSVMDSHRKLDRSLQELAYGLNVKLERLAGDLAASRNQTELDTFMLALTRLWSKYPRWVGFWLLVLLTFITGPSILQTMQRVSAALVGPPISTNGMDGPSGAIP